MFEIKVTVTNPQEREHAEYAQHHIEEFCYGLNGAYVTICEGDVSAFDIPEKYENYPGLIVLYNFIFTNNDTD